ncbi:MAG TPA: hypothetical protein DCF61_13890 [Alphaproteobacteria bacterium]|jgi:hypothetical protein|nr:hypothetical protein [Alphaproteobacteria bacterium]HBA43302.1 hypothetical protein [Alphaproteobacteria bacterium]HBC54687.1 hypothetical protein [Alphaproteobacteria bacterium]HCO89389.1 hypothetical protein [Alphaproteobacteria bacterium]
MHSNIAEQADSTAWKGEILRDTLTYRFIDISITLIDLMMENSSISNLYFSWLEEQERPDNQDTDREIRPVILTEMKNETGSAVMILGLPVSGQFLVIFQNKYFNANIIIAQNIETGELQASSVSEFNGDLTYALSWGHDFINRVDTEMITADI